MHPSDTGYKVLPNTPGAHYTLCVHYLCQQRVSWMDCVTCRCHEVCISYCMLQWNVKHQMMEPL